MKFKDFQGLEKNYLVFQDLQGPYEPCTLDNSQSVGYSIHWKLLGVTANLTAMSAVLLWQKTTFIDILSTGLNTVRLHDHHHQSRAEYSSKELTKLHHFVKGWDFCQFPCHMQAVEKTVETSQKHQEGCVGTNNGCVRFNLLSRKIVPTLDQTSTSTSTCHETAQL